MKNCPVNLGVLLKVAIWKTLPHLTGDRDKLTQLEAIFAEP
jgi:hypothetical protein